MVKTSPANHPVNIASAHLAPFHHVDRIASEVVPRVLTVMVVVCMSPEEFPAPFGSLLVNQHGLGANIDPETRPDEAPAKVGVDVINKQIFVK